MDYRSPHESLRRELARLEDELTALRALPDPEPRPRTRSKKEAAKVARESRELTSELAKLEHQIQKRTKELGIRELTPREVARSVQTRRVALGSTILGLLVFSVHLASAARPHLWAEATCSTRYDGDTHLAEYVVDGRTYSFYAGEQGGRALRCWVPSPPRGGVGRMAPPLSPDVRIVEKLSIGWTITAGLLVVFGIMAASLGVLDLRRRQRGEIDPDDFASDS